MPHLLRISWNSTAFVPLLLVAAVSGCATSRVIGPLQHEDEERSRVLIRARRAGVSPEILTAVQPPLTTEELQAMRSETDSCRSSYVWKGVLTWTGGGFVAVAAALTIGGAYASSITNKTDQILFGVSSGTLAALGGVLGIGGGIVDQGFMDRGCWVR
jgi:hypothetical protein